MMLLPPAVRKKIRKQPETDSEPGLSPYSKANRLTMKGLGYAHPVRFACGSTAPYCEEPGTGPT
jgi:hypothetical protein